MSRKASGLKAWAIQRITAIYLGLFVLYAFFHLMFNAPADHAAWREWVSSIPVSLSLLLFAASLLIHAWVGMRDVFIDYVHPIGIRVTLLSLLAIGLIGCGLWTAQVLFLARLAA